MTAMDGDDLLVRIAWLYYIEDLTQQEIGDRLHLPRVKVTRLLKQARDEGIVEFRIVKPTVHLEFERELRLHFGLKDAIVIPTPLDSERLRPALGEAAAKYLQPLFRPGLVIGLGMGRTLAEIPDFVEPIPNSGCVFREMVGGSSRADLGLDTYNVSWRLAERCGGVVEHIFAPLLVESTETREALWNDPHIVVTLEKAAQCDVGVVGIGDAGDDMLLSQLGCCDDGTVRDLHTRGAVGDILGHFFDINGQSVRCEMDERLIALNLDQLRAIPTMIAVAGGAEKTLSILGALHGSYVNVLITDMESAQAVLQESRERGFQDING